MFWEWFKQHGDDVFGFVGFMFALMTQMPDLGLSKQDLAWATLLSLGAAQAHKVFYPAGKSLPTLTKEQENVK